MLFFLIFAEGNTCLMTRIFVRIFNSSESIRMTLQRSNITFSIIWILLICFYENYNCKAEQREYEPGEDLASPLYCKVNNSGQSSWFHKYRVLTRGSNVFIEKERIQISTKTTEYNLMIKMMKKGDEGNYTCKENNVEIVRYTLIAKESAKIDIYSGPTVETTGGATIHLWCNATGYPKPTATWHVYQQSEGQKKETLTDIGISGSMLGIRNVSQSCATKYQCQAINSYKMDKPVTRNITVVVKDSTTQSNGGT